MAKNHIRPRLYGAGWVELIALIKKIGQKKVLEELKANKDLSRSKLIDNKEAHFAQTEETKEDLTYNVFSTKIRTLEELIVYHEIDTETWEAAYQKVNYWEMGAKLPDGTITTSPLHQIKANFTRKNTTILLKNIGQGYSFLLLIAH